MQNNVGIYASQISGHLWAPNGAYDALATATVGSGGAASVTFAGIPQEYKHLQIRYLLKANAFAAWNQIRFNSDSGNNYTYHELYGTGSAASTGNGTAVNGWNFNYNNSGSDFSAGVIDIFNYTSTNKYKTSRCLHGYDANGTGVVVMKSGLWLNTSAISQIEIIGGTSFLQYTQFALYGVK